MTPRLYTRDQAKARAKAIRAEHKALGHVISHSAALEKLAREQGFADWNTLSARLGNAPEIPLQVGDRVCGSYLKKPFEGVVHAVANQGHGAAFDIVIDFDEPVDVVEFESFSNFRSRVQARISAGGTSFMKTSDGIPHMIVTRAGDIVV